MKTEHHEIMLLIAQSLHSRLQALEQGSQVAASLGIGFDDVTKFLDDAEDALTKIYNIEQTVQLYLRQADEIFQMCRQPNPNWADIFMAILALLEGEDAIKARRDEQMIVAIKANLLTLETIEELHGQEMRSKLGASFLGNPFQVINDAKQTVKAVINFKNTIQSISVKFQLIREEIHRVDQWDVWAMIRLTVRIIEIIEEEDSVKKQRDRQLLALISTVTETFAVVTGKLQDFEPKKTPYKLKKFQNQGAIDFYKDYWNTGTDPRHPIPPPPPRPPARPSNDGAGDWWGAQNTVRNGDGAGDWWGAQNAGQNHDGAASYYMQGNLGNPISDALSIIKQVMQTIEAIKNIEQSISTMTNRYSAVVDHLQKLDLRGDPRSIVPFLIDLIRTLKGEEKLKIERDIHLVENMKQITLQLHAAGYHIV
jgi:hypothetical protein